MTCLQCVDIGRPAREVGARTGRSVPPSDSFGHGAIVVRKALHGAGCGRTVQGIGVGFGGVHDRRLLREVQVNIAIRWFIGNGLHECLPDHSSRTRIRKRWGEERFREIFKRTVTGCLGAKIATAEVVHIDASLIRADVSWNSLAERHVGKVVTENGSDQATEAKKEPVRRRGPPRRVSRTDPDASMATSALQPAT